MNCSKMNSNHNTIVSNVKVAPFSGILSKHVLDKFLGVRL